MIPALGDEGKSASLRAPLSGFNEVISAGGAVFSDGSGRFRGRITGNQQSIGYELTYQVVETVATAGTQYGIRPTSTSASDTRPEASSPGCATQPTTQVPLPPRRSARVRAALSRGPSRPLMSWRWLTRVFWPATSRLWWRRSGPGRFTLTFTRMPSEPESCVAKSTVAVTTNSNC